MSIRDVATMAHSMNDRAMPKGESFGLEATNFYDPPMATITNGTHIAQIAIDPVTGLVEIERYVVVHDCGRLINPLIVDGQIHGAVVQGISSVLSEAFYYDDQGQALTASLLDYLVSTALATPTWKSITRKVGRPTRRAASRASAKAGHWRTSRGRQCDHRCASALRCEKHAAAGSAGCGYIVFDG